MNNLIKYIKNFKITLLIIMAVFSSNLESSLFLKAFSKKYDCLSFRWTCTNNILCQIYPNQNMCVLLGEIPFELRNLCFAVYPNCIAYNTERFIFNKRFNIFPHAIFKPNTCQELVYVFNILKKYNLEFSVRSGGHCFEPGSISTGYIIDLENFNSVCLDKQKGEVFIGAGCRLGGVIQKLAKLGFAIPTGTCGSNGITGLALGGGDGFLTRKFGYTCDVITSITLLNAQGEIIIVDNNNFSDLFWALRGAGANSFGIVLGFTFKVAYVPCVSLVQLDWVWNQTQVPQIMQAWQDWIATLPNEITAELDFDYVNGSKHVTMIAMKVGNQALTEWVSAFAGLNPTVTVNRTMTYLEAANLVGDVSPLPYLKTKSKILVAPLTNLGIQVIVDYFEQLSINNKQFSVHLEFDSVGGQSALGDTAFFPRSAIIIFYMHMRWNNQNQEADALTSINSFYTAIEPFTSPYSYANVIDFDLGATYLNAYYGTNVPRLLEIKKKYDPQNIFHWQQSIPVV